MAGDHKCPVCKSTFTRPQHVARHMRSHTGDRPYKCTHCGDQFARSDLLSRHINKCHASEKPPTTKSRRRGTAAGSRAITSKQACDQCVTNALPCDGAKPCSKCRGSKDRCTYIQFHRQTAPSGPGHPVPQPERPDIFGRPPIPIGAGDEFLLAPISSMVSPPGAMDLASMYAHPHYMTHPSDVYSQEFTNLPPLAASLTSAATPHSALLQAQQREALEDHDAMARYHAQAEMFSRAGVMSSGGLTLAQPAPTADTSAALPGLYAAAQDAQYDRYNMPPPSNQQSQQQWESQPQYHHHARNMEAPYAPRSQGHSSVPPISTASATGGEPTHHAHPPSGGPPSSYEAGTSGPDGSYRQPALPPSSTLYSQHHVPRHHHQHSRSDDLSSSEGDFASDACSTSQSIPSSASSSAVHLPLPGFNNLRTKSQADGKDSYEQRYTAGGHDQNAPENESGFSSVFGLMSLDDPNVLAGMASDGQPFFSNASSYASNQSSSALPGPGGLPLATPTQDLIAQLKSAGGREGMDNKELRDFWKMYLRTPLTGPSSSSGNGNSVMFPLQTPTGPGIPLGHSAGQSTSAGRPSPSRRHSRVASLPSMKTPPIYTDERIGGMYAQRPSTGDHSESQSQATGIAGAYNSTVRTTLHGAEDLKSYEQAVLARKAPMNLNLVPRRKGSLANPSPSHVQNPPLGKSKSMSPVVPHAGFSSGPASFPLSSSNKISDLLNRPSSTSSTGTNGTTTSSGSGISIPSNSSAANTTLSQHSSSLAHVFGGEGAPLSEGSVLVHSPPSDAYASDKYRPSFKRIASQTLGPDNAKRASLGPAGWDLVRYEEDDEEERNDKLPEKKDADSEGRKCIPSSALPSALPDSTGKASLTVQAQS